MLEKSFIEKSRFALGVLLTVTGVLIGANLKITKAAFTDALEIVHLKKADAATLSVDMWWPADGAQVQGVQPFKGMLENTPVDQYTMYWKVDDGNLVPMNTNTTDYPHKEASVDLSGWNWKGKGPYKITFVAKDNSGNEISEKSATIYNTAAQSQSVSPQTPTVSPSNNPLSSLNLYIDPNSNAVQQVRNWQSSRPNEATQISKIANQSQGIWIGDWSDVYTTVHTAVQSANSKGQTPTFIAYDIPERDCGSYSAGGANSAGAYQNWIQSVKNGIGNGKAIVILEPDAVAGITCLSQNDQNTRYSLLQNAITTLKSNSGTYVYLDAGNSHWVSADDMAGRLQKAGIAQADGFALNVSNYYTTDDNISYGSTLSKLIENKHFVIDTSRNGNGSNGDWCNPSGRSLGQKPTTSTGNNLVDAYLWAKDPGESDGTCNGGPNAGVWWADYALGLAERATY